MRGQAAEIVDGIIASVSRGAMNTPALRALRRAVSKQIRDVDRSVVLEIGNELIQRAPAGRFIAYELVHHHKSTMESINTTEVEALGGGISSWDQVDTFAVYVSGPAWCKGRISDAVVKRWARSQDRWWRRAALVSTVPLNSGGRDGRGEINRTLAICEMLINDRDDMVVKAMSWALRALSKRESRQVETFIERHREELAPRVIREVRNKLATGLKNPRKQSSA